MKSMGQLRKLRTRRNRCNNCTRSATCARLMLREFCRRTDVNQV
jgi:hypothetical protein